MSFLREIVAFQQSKLSPTVTVERNYIPSSICDISLSLRKEGVEELREFYDSPAQFERNVGILSELIRSSKKTVLFTG